MMMRRAAAATAKKATKARGGDNRNEQQRAVIDTRHGWGTVRVAGGGEADGRQRARHYGGRARAAAGEDG